MKRISVPDWARPFSILREQEFDELEFNRCLPHRAEVVQAVQEAVQQFANDDEKVFSEDFPQRTRLTGEYYLSNENYSLYKIIRSIQGRYTLPSAPKSANIH